MAYNARFAKLSIIFVIVDNGTLLMADYTLLMLGYFICLYICYQCTGCTYLRKYTYYNNTLILQDNIKYSVGAKMHYLFLYMGTIFEMLV